MVEDLGHDEPWHTGADHEARAAVLALPKKAVPISSRRTHVLRNLGVQLDPLQLTAALDAKRMNGDRSQ